MRHGPGGARRRRRSPSQTAPVEAAIRSPYERCPDLALGGWGVRKAGAVLFL
jgi:hypothetical protein